MNINIKALAAALMLLIAALPAYAEDMPRIMDIEHVAIHKKLFDIPVEIVPRAGYNFTKVENGITDTAKKVTFTAIELHMPYQRLLAEITGDRMKEKNMEVKSHWSFIWNGRQAELMKIFQPNGENMLGKWVLIIDRSFNLCWMISGAYDAKDAETSLAVVETLKTAWWPDDSASSISAGTLTAGTDTRSTPFRIAGFRQDSVIYTRDGRIPTQSPDGALFVISSIDCGYIPIERRAQYAKEHLAEIERGADLEIISETTETVNGFPAVVTVAYTKGERRSLIYQAAVFHNMKSAMLVGIARENTAENLECFHTLTENYSE